MPVEFIILLICVGIGSVVGVLAGMLGIGGGLIIVPALTYILSYFLGIAFFDDYHSDRDVLIDHYFNWITSSRAHFALGNVNREIVLYCALGIALGASLGAQTASILDGKVLKGAFAALVILVALQMIFGKNRAPQ